MKTLALVLSTLLVVACGQKSGGGAAHSGASPTSEDDKTLYALGLLAGRQLANLKLLPQELEMVQRGINDAATGATPEVQLDTYGPKVQAMARTRAAANAAAAAAVEKTKDQPYLDAAEKEQGAEKTASGMVYKELTPGTGDSPKPTDRVKVNYEGKLIDGTVFDSSYKRNQPATFGLNGVIPCWTEGVQKMKVGGTAQLVCPSTIAYGDQGHPPTIPGGAVLTFKVELISIEAAGAAPAPAPGLPPGLNMGGRPMMGGPGGMQMMAPGAHLQAPAGVQIHPAPAPGAVPAAK
jgi:FKBP-type peptidyl-prolyl cis-trans isomerase FkpA